MAKSKKKGGRVTVSRRKMCPICLLNPANTKEDVIPDWSRQIYRTFGEYERGQLPSALMPMCRDCNGTYGKVYEDKAKDILAPLVAGERRSLSPADQEFIGRWVIKTDLLWALAFNNDLSEERRETFRRVCLKLKIEEVPPDLAFFVRIGGFDVDAATDAPGHSDLHAVGRIPTVYGRAAASLGWITTEFAIGSPDELGAFIHSCSDNASLVRIWPPQMSTVEWPTDGLVTRDIYTLRAAWNARQWPPPPETPVEFRTNGHRIGLYRRGPSTSGMS